MLAFGGCIFLLVIAFRGAGATGAAGAAGAAALIVRGHAGATGCPFS